jgi:hypothetical protein
VNRVGPPPREGDSDFAIRNPVEIQSSFSASTDLMLGETVEPLQRMNEIKVAGRIKN